MRRSLVVPLFALVLLLSLIHSPYAKSADEEADLLNFN